MSASGGPHSDPSQGWRRDAARQCSQVPTGAKLLGLDSRAQDVVDDGMQAGDREIPP